MRDLPKNIAMGLTLGCQAPDDATDTGLELDYFDVIAMSSAHCDLTVRLVNSAPSPCCETRSPTPPRQDAAAPSRPR